MLSHPLHLDLITRQGPRWKPVVRNSLKKEDKGPPDNMRSGKKKKKSKQRRKRRRWRPEEINPFKEPISQQSLPAPSIREVADSEIEGFDMERILGTTDLEEMFKRLDMMEDDSDTEDENSVLNGDITEFLDSSDEILDFVNPYEDNKEMDEEDYAEFDYTFDERGAEEFIKIMKNVDPDEFFRKNKNLVKEVEERLAKQRAKGLIPLDDANMKWSNSYEQFCWDVVRLLFPRRGKRDHRQNWDHINVSEKVKQKRAKKKAKGYSIWLSMELTKTLKNTLKSLHGTPVCSERRVQIVESCLRRFSSLLRYQEHKFDLMNLTSMLHSIALIHEKLELPSWVVRNYSKLIFSLFAKIEDQMKELTARSVCEVLWSLLKFGPELSTQSSEMLPLEMTSLRTVNYTDFVNSVLTQLKSPGLSFNAKDLVICFCSLILMDWIESKEEVTEKLMNQVVEKVQSLNHHDIAVVLNCCTKADYPLRPKFVAELVQNAIQCAPDFTPQGLANTVHSLAKFKYFNCQRMMQLFLGEMERKIMKFKPQEVANMMTGCARLMYLPSGQTLNLVANISIQKMDQFSFQGASNLIWAYAVFGHPHNRLIQAVKAKIVFYKEAEMKRSWVFWIYLF
eukprot:g5410.t1